MSSGENIQRLREERGWSRPQLGQRMGTSGQQIERLEKGQRKLTTEWIDKAASAFGVSATQVLSGYDRPRARSEPDQLPTRTVDAGEGATILRMDLSYAMGPGTNIDEDYVESEPVLFDLGFLRSLTPSPPEALRVVNGVGDSMQPTVHDREDLIIDTAQRTLNMQDRIWAISLFGVGALKRLQVISKDKVLVISDNPDAPNGKVEVNASDITIVGRLVGSIKRH